MCTYIGPAKLARFEALCQVPFWNFVRKEWGEDEEGVTYDNIAEKACVSAGHYLTNLGHDLPSGMDQGHVVTQIAEVLQDN